MMWAVLGESMGLVGILGDRSIGPVWAFVAFLLFVPDGDSVVVMTNVCRCEVISVGESG